MHIRQTYLSTNMFQTKLLFVFFSPISLFASESTIFSVSFSFLIANIKFLCKNVQFCRTHQFTLAKWIHPGVENRFSKNTNFCRWTFSSHNTPIIKMLEPFLFKKHYISMIAKSKFKNIIKFKKKFVVIDYLLSLSPIF